jgi:hypothetical protein
MNNGSIDTANNTNPLNACYIFADIPEQIQLRRRQPHDGTRPETDLAIQRTTKATRTGRLLPACPNSPKKCGASEGAARELAIFRCERSDSPFPQDCQRSLHFSASFKEVPSVTTSEVSESFKPMVRHQTPIFRIAVSRGSFAGSKGFPCFIFARWRQSYSSFTRFS